MTHGKVFIVSAPSGTGKTTVSLAVLAALQSKIPIERVITYTTRPIRHNEQPGIDYHFISMPAFLQKIADNFFFEVTRYNNHCYGSPRSFIDGLAKGISYIIITDRDGAQSLKQNLPNTVTIWLMPPSVTELERRLTQRATENKADIMRRIKIAEQEMLLEKNNPFFDIHITNDIFENTVSQLCSLIISELKKPTPEKA